MTKSKKLRTVARWLLLFLVVVIAAGGGMAIYFAEEIRRLEAVVTLFNEDRILTNFRGMDDIFESKVVHRGDTPSEFDRGDTTLPETFEYEGETINVAEFLKATDTTALAIYHDGELVHETYYLGNDETTTWISWSVAKSVVSALIGIAIEDGHIGDVMDPVTKYVPFLNGSGYEGVPIKHVLQMSSGVKFDETYADFNSDINRMGRALALNTPLDEFIATLVNEKPSGTFNHYVSMDTQVLAMVLREATGKSLAENTEERIWKPLGMESDAYWIVDGAGMELAFGGLNAVLRDYLRFGVLYLNEGNWKGIQIVPRDWVRASVTPDAPHLQPGENPNSNWVLGYGYQWWIPREPEGDFMAVGVYGQFIYVHPTHKVVIAKNSAYANYNVDGDQMELKTDALFRTIARHVAGAARPIAEDASP